MNEHAITYSTRNQDEPVLWAWRRGSEEAAEMSARRLLENLVERDFKKAKVFVDGRKIKLKMEFPLTEKVNPV